jgi:hypothetical protein
LKKFIIQLGVLTVFFDTHFLFKRGTFNFDFYDYYLAFAVIIVYFILAYRSLKLAPVWFFQSMALLLFGTVFGAYINGYFGFGLYKTLGGILFSATTYYLVFRIAEFNVAMLFRYYLRFAFWISIFGIAQELLALSGIPLFFGATAKAVGGTIYRVSATSGEPYFLSTVLLPALIYYAYIFLGPMVTRQYRLSGDQLKLAIISTCFALTFSTAGFFVMFLGVLLMTIDKARLEGWGLRILYFPIAAFGIYTLSTFLAEKDTNYRNRVNDSLLVINSSPSTQELNNLNSSSFSLTSNYYILRESFAENPIFGTGIGTYENIYDKFFDKIFGESFRLKYLDQNSKDGNSMFIRMLAETGIWGMGLFLFFIFRNSAFRKKYWMERPSSFYAIIIQSCLLLFILRLLRTGNYIGQGFFFFFFLYYYAKAHIMRQFKDA